MTMTVKADYSEMILNSPFCCMIGRLANKSLMNVRVCSLVWFGNLLRSLDAPLKFIRTPLV